MRIRRWYSVLVALCLCISVMTACGKEPSSGGNTELNPSVEPTQRKETPVEDFTYEMIDGEVIITGYTGVAREIVIPGTINERTVTQIGEQAFAEYDLTLVDIPEDVKIIHKNAFADCNCLVDVRLPEGLKRIERFAFNSCDSLETVAIPEGLQFLGYGSLANTGIRRLELPYGFSGFEVERSVLSFEIDEDGNRKIVYADMIQNPVYNSDAVLVVEEGSEALKQLKLYGYDRIDYEIKKKEMQSTDKGEIKNEAQSGKVTMYLLKEWETYNESGEVLSRKRYTYNDNGMVLTATVDDPTSVTEWDEQLACYVYQMRPCDGVVNRRQEYFYDENGMLSGFDDSKNPACDVEYVYDIDGRLSKYALSYPNTAMATTEFELKRDNAGNVTEVWSGSRLWIECSYDRVNRISKCVVHHREYTEGLIYSMEYDEDGRVIRCDRNGSLFTLHCSYNKDGYLESIGGNDFSYENGILSAIGDSPVELSRDNNGNLTMEVNDSKLYYEAVILSEEDATLARYTWNQLFGSLPTGYFGERYYHLFGIHWPYYELDTQLMLPYGLWFN